MLAEARARIPAGIPVAVRVPAASSPARGLTELAETEHADLIVVGSAKGAADDGRIGLARTAGRLLAGAPCAVAVAPPGLRETGPFHHVGVAVDGSPEAAAALQAGYAIARGRRQRRDALLGARRRHGPRRATTRCTRGSRIQERLDAAADAAPAGVNPRTVFLHGAAGREDRRGLRRRRRPAHLRLAGVRPGAAGAARQRQRGAHRPRPPPGARHPAPARPRHG